MAGAETQLLVSHRRLDRRKHGGLGKPVTISRRDEPVFRTEFDIAQAKTSKTADGRRITLRNDRMQLQIRQRAIVHFQLGQHAAPPAGCFRTERYQIDLEMLKIHRLGIIGAKRRTGKRLRGYQQRRGQAHQPASHHPTNAIPPPTAADSTTTTSGGVRHTTSSTNPATTIAKSVAPSTALVHTGL